MTRKKEVKLLGLLTLIFLTAAAVLYWRANPQQHKTETLLAPIDLNDIAGFQIEHFTNALLFKKEGEGNWLVKQVKGALAEKIEAGTKEKVANEDENFVNADPELVAQALMTLTQVKKTPPIAVTQDSSSFEINPYSLNVRLFDKEGIALETVYIGKNGPEFFSTFIKKGDGPEIFLANANLRGLFLRDFKGWVYEDEEDKKK